MNGEEGTRRLLKIRGDLEDRMARLQSEIEDLRAAVVEIDRFIARHGFSRPSLSTSTEETGSGSIKAKDGTVLGTIQIDEKEMVFTPREDLPFAVTTPPFGSFLIDRVLANMRSSDEDRVASGQVQPEDVLSYEVIAEGERITGLTVRNYNGERRLREIRSSLRWTFDKMYDKLRQG